MTCINMVLLMGNVTRDPQLRKTAGGTSVLDLGLALNRSYVSKNGERVRSTCFTDVVVWGKQAETCARYVTKGCAVMVEGRLHQDQWETEQGEKRRRLRVLAERVHFVRRAGEEASERPPSEEKPSRFPRPGTKPSSKPQRAG